MWRGLVGPGRAHRARIAVPRAMDGATLGRWEQCALQPGGWDAAGLDRRACWSDIWASRPLAPAADLDTASPHPDEGQVDLDVQRSFGHMHGTDERDRRRDQLRRAIRMTLRRYPALRYFQGFHDVVAHVLLTMCPDATDEAAWAPMQRVVDQVSLHFLRDCMTRDLMPAMGQLKIVRNILRAADAPYAYALENAFYPNHLIVALPWLLTLFTHEISAPAHALRVLDYVWCAGPASTLYLCAAFLLARKERVAQVATETRVAIEALDIAELHPVLASAPTEGAADDSALTRVLQDAAHLARTFPLRCPAVHAHLVLGDQSVLFTWDKQDTAPLSVLALPPTQLALDPLPTPRDEPSFAWRAAPTRGPRTRDILRHMVQAPRLRRLSVYPPVLLLSSLSLCLGGGALSVMLALFLAQPRS